MTGQHRRMWGPAAIVRDLGDPQPAGRRRKPMSEWPAPDPADRLVTLPITGEVRLERIAEHRAAYTHVNAGASGLTPGLLPDPHTTGELSHEVIV